MSFDSCGKLFEFHPKAEVGLIRTVICHSFSVWKPFERFFEFDSPDLPEKKFCEPLECVEYIVSFNERHFAVDLGEFRLSVCSQVLIAETFHNLEVFIEACNHKQLLESLGRLGKCVESSGLHPAGNNKIACSLGSGFNKNWRFHLNKTYRIHIFPNLLRHLVAKHYIVFHGTSPKVEVPVFHPDLFTPVSLLLNCKRWQLASVQDYKPGDFNLDLSSRNFNIFIAPLLYFP